MIELACPACSHPFLGVTVVGEHLVAMRPTPGDMSICLHCAAIIHFGEASVRLAAPIDLAELPEEMLDDLALARLTVQAQRYQHTP